MRHLTRWVLLSYCVLITMGCVTLTTNHYQDANALGKKEKVGGVSLGVVSGFPGVPEIDSTGYVFEEGDATSIISPSIGLLGVLGVGDHVDLGIELSTSLGSGEVKPFAKYQFTRSNDPLQVAIMGAVGVGRGGGDITTNDGIDTTESHVIHQLLSIEVPLLISYRFPDSESLTLAPKLFYQSIKSRHTESVNGVKTGMVQSASYHTFAPAIGLGFKTRSVAGEFTYLFRKDMASGEYVGVPEFGVAFYGWEGLFKLIMKLI